MNQTDMYYLFCTIFGEARGEPIEGIIAVANVIKNRAYAAQKLYKDICLAKDQFSCWNDSDPNYPMITKLLADAEAGYVFTDIFIRQCLAIAKAIYEGDFRDNITGAKNYVTLKRYQLAQSRRDSKLDGWINKMKPVKTYGQHIFLID